MKYDCYPRFLRSLIYRQCVQALENDQPPPVPEPTLSDPDLNIHGNFAGADGDGDSLDRNMPLKKSESDAGERRRRSLLPWPKKDRSKSKVGLLVHCIFGWTGRVLMRRLILLYRAGSG